MSVEIISYPVGWVAVHSPVKLTFLRKDITDLSISYSNAKLIVRFSTILTVDLTGKQIYINCGRYVGYYTVASVYNGGTYYELRISTGYLGAAYGGYIVSDYIRVNYKIQVSVYSNGTLITDELRFGTFTDGTAETDLKEILKSQIPQFPTAALTGDCIRSDTYSLFSFKFTETYEYYEGVTSNLYYFYGCNAVKQNGDINGSSMTGYAPSYDTSSFPFTVTKGKFLQEFAEPIININSDFELSFIWQGDQLQYFPITITYTYKDINKAIISTQQVLLSRAQAGGVTRLNLSNLTIPALACYITVKAEVGDTRPHYVESGYVETGYVE